MLLIYEGILTVPQEHPHLDGKQLIQYDDQDNLGITDYSRDQIIYHLVMLIEAGLVKGEMVYSGPIISKLTWQGHDFLDSVRDPEIWQKLRTEQKRPVDSALNYLGHWRRDLSRKKLRSTLVSRFKPYSI